ncbi:MAG: three-Cys-motif partner protein TcmP [Planctomycetota bacterium]
MMEPDIDVVGYWTEVKLNILRDYSNAYATILSKQRSIKHFAYIDGFAGGGTHISKTTGMEIKGSPSIALNLEPKFSHYHFIDMDGKRTARLKKLAEGRADVTVYTGDCNSILLDKVFPQCRYDNFRRALCLLDPYELNPNWHVVQTAGQMKSIEIFLNFMIMDANMNVLWRNRDKVLAAQVERMKAFWGDDSWSEAGYTTEPGLFGNMERKTSNEDVVAAYRKRLQDIAGFKYVPDPLPMRNSNGAVIYYLFFASHKQTGDKIAKAIFKKYRDREMTHGH